MKIIPQIGSENVPTLLPCQQIIYFECFYMMFLSYLLKTTITFFLTESLISCFVFICITLSFHKRCCLSIQNAFRCIMHKT